MAKRVSAEPDMKEFAARICKDYLYGPWKSVTSQNIGFKHISGGLSNLLYHVWLPDSLTKDLSDDPEDPKEVLIRVYGQTHGEHALEALITESVVFTLLSERGLGPKLHGVFPGGRIEEYINARPLVTKELSDEQLSRKIAHKMAAIHSMEVPLHKEPGWLWNTIERWLKTCDSKLSKTNEENTDGNTSKVPDFITKLFTLDLRNECQWLKNRLEMENCPVVFCHNDLQEGNILIKLDGKNENNNNCDDSEIVVIDFEYCSYNYRSFDLANHFLEWTTDYTNTDPPFFYDRPENYPTEEQRMRFIKSYLKARNSNENPKHVLKQVEVFTLASHFFWSLWGLVNAETSQIPFGYWEYAAMRFRHYLEQKNRFALDLSTPGLKRKSCTLE